MPQEPCTCAAAPIFFRMYYIVYSYFRMYHENERNSTVTLLHLPARRKKLYRRGATLLDISTKSASDGISVTHHLGHIGLTYPHGTRMSLSASVQSTLDSGRRVRSCTARTSSFGGG